MRAAGCAAILAGLTLQGCSSYIYSGSALYPDDAGVERCYGVQWSVTRYAWVYGTRTDAIDLRLAGGSDSIHYAETPADGIVSRTEADETIPDDLAGLDSPGLCGRVLGVDRIRHIRPGPGALRLTFRCAIERDGFSVGDRVYPAARAGPYTFDIESRETGDPQADAPATPLCD